MNIIVTLALVLGLLGTVTRMMGAFNHITQRMENPMGVTAGLAEALITTVFGLCIFIVAVRKKETCSVCCHPERRRA